METRQKGKYGTEQRSISCGGVGTSDGAVQVVTFQVVPDE